MGKQERGQIQNLEILLIDEEFIEQYVINKSKEEVRMILGRCADIEHHDEWVYIVRSYFYGFYRKTLHVYFRDGISKDYYL